MMLESWKETVDKNHAFGALMTDLSKAYDCPLVTNLLIAKLHVYRINLLSLKASLRLFITSLAKNKN